MTTVLETHNLVKRFGGIVATSDVTFNLEHGARHALIGPNGAGKTTFINQLTGVLQPTSGRIGLEGRDITQLRPEARVRLGLARTFQINQLFPTLTPLETLTLAVSERLGAGRSAWRSIAKVPLLSREVAEVAERFGLADVLDQTTASLPYGRQRQLEIAVAFAAKPRVLLLDEPAAGVPEAERDDILAAIAALPAEVAVLLIEHDMDLVFRFADRISVLVSGAIMAEDVPDKIAADPLVRQLYLGEAAHG